MCRLSKRNELIGMIISQLVEELSGEQLETVKRILEETVSDYEIEPRNTEIVPADEFVPKYYAIYLARKKLAGRSVETLKLYNFYLMDFFLNKPAPVDQMDSTLMIHYLYDYQKRKGVSNYTLDQCRIIINGFFAWAANEGYVAKNFVGNINPIKYIAKPRNPINEEEFEIVRCACETYRERAIVDILFYTGIRISELANLKWSDIDMNKKTMVILGKGSKYRTVVFNGITKVSLLKYKMSKCGNNEYVVTSDKYPYNGLNKSSIGIIIKKMNNRVQLSTKLTAHVFRHSFATVCLRKGMPIEQLRVLLGHKSLDTTLIYSKINLTDVEYEYHKCFGA